MKRDGIRLFCLLMVCLLSWSAAGLPVASGATQALPGARGFVAPGGSTQAAANTPAKNTAILILSDAQDGMPVPDAILDGIMDTLNRKGISVKNVFAEYLDLTRYPDPEHRANFLTLLRHKLAHRHVGLIIVLNQKALEFLAADAKDLLPGVPALAVNVQRSDVLWAGAPRKIIDLFPSIDVAGTLRYATTLFPDARRLVVINGRDDSIVPWMETTAQALENLHRKLAVEYTESLSYEEMLHRIATLPADTIALLGIYFRDRTGRVFIPAEVAAAVAKTANAPVFGLVDVLISQGLIGGSAAITSRIGRQAGEIAFDYLKGKIPLARQKTRFPIINTPLFNWPQLKRWGVDANRLPADSLFINRPPTLWREYKTAVILALLVIIVLIILIVALILKNRRLKVAEQAARESEESFRTLFDDHVAVKLIIDPATGNIVKANNAAAAYYGWSCATLAQMNIQDINLLSPEAINQVMEKALTAKRNHFEFQHRRADGSIRDVAVFSSGVTIKGRAYLHAIVQDITERKQLEAKRIILEERLHRSEKMEALGQLAGGVAHDLNNVLGSTMGYAELLQEQVAEGSDQRKYADSIFAATEKAAAIIKDLLTLTRRGVSAFKAVNLNGMASRVLKSPEVENLRNYYPSVNFTTELDENLLNMNGSPVHLEKTIFNLLSNAAEAISGEGRVTIRTENRYIDSPVHGYDEAKEGEYAVLAISDTGEGINAEDLKKIFEPFYTKKKMGRSGTGLGLAIVWGTVKDHGGYVDVESTEGKGTTFTLYFPATREKIAEDSSKIPIEHYLGRGESILIVDDVAEQRQIAIDILARLGYQVHAVSGGREALEHLKNNKADVLVLDMIMDPEIDGLETYRRVLTINPEQKAILVSGFSETALVKEAQKLGAGAYVTKPYIMEKIGVAVRQELDRKG